MSDESASDAQPSGLDFEAMQSLLEITRRINAEVDQDAVLDRAVAGG